MVPSRTLSSQAREQSSLNEGQPDAAIAVIVQSGQAFGLEDVGVGGVEELEGDQPIEEGTRISRVGDFDGPRRKHGGSPGGSESSPW